MGGTAASVRVRLLPGPCSWCGALQVSASALCCPQCRSAIVARAVLLPLVLVVDGARGFQVHCYVLHAVPQDMIIPLMSSPNKYHASPLLGAPTRKRHILAYFNGGCLEACLLACAAWQLTVCMLVCG
jgi:hypothetical protein